MLYIYVCYIYVYLTIIIIRFKGNFFLKFFYANKKMKRNGKFNYPAFNIQ